MNYRGRFAPSPTGDLHLGTARTALVAWLLARRNDGRFFLRIEDIDTPRIIAGSAEKILEDLHWLGLNWDGPVIYQSERSKLYEEALVELERTGRVYPCTCSRKEIAEIASAPHGKEPVYPGTCRLGVSHPDRDPALRFRVDEPQDFEDSLAGKQTGSPGDFVLRRAASAGGEFAYHLACAVDDAQQGITEVVRGDDLLSSTSRQVALLTALARPRPEYFHLPLLLGEDGQRLAKRHGAVSIAQYRLAGWTPERVVGLLAGSLDLVREGDTIMPQALIHRFDPFKIPRENVRFKGPQPDA